MFVVYENVKLTREVDELTQMLDNAEGNLVDSEDNALALTRELTMMTKHVKDLEEKLNPEPFKPELGLTDLQNKLCLAITAFTETNGEPTLARETMSWAIINRAIDPRAADGKSRAYKTILVQ